MTKDEEAALTMRAETAEMLLEAEREEVERLRAELAQAQAQLEGKEPPKQKSVEEQLQERMLSLMMRDMYPPRYPEGKLVVKVNKNPYEDRIEVVLSLDIPGAPRNHCAFSMPRYTMYLEDVKQLVIKALGNMPQISMASVAERDIDAAAKHILKESGRR